MARFLAVRKDGQVYAHGIQGKRELVAINAHSIVVRRKGYAENPGTRNSGLRSYYPAEIEVYRVVSFKPTTPENYWFDGEVEGLIAYPVRNK